MSDATTTPGTSLGRHAWFTTTHWSVVLAARDGQSSEAAAALEQLCQTYWRPLYSYIRRDGHGVEAAQDLTQEFFARLLEKEYLSRLQHQNGKFRSFLLTFLKHFLSDQRDRANAQKRGGGQTFISLEAAREEEQSGIEPIDGLSADQIFERRWARAVLEQAAHRLQQEYVAEGKGALFEQLKDLQPGQHGARSFAELGAQLGLTESAMKSAVHRFRQRHREILREEIANTVASPDEIEDEIRHLMKVLSG